MAMTQRGARDLVADITTATAEGDYDVAARAAAWGIESFPDAAVFHRLRGTALVALGVNEEAKANLNHALSVDPLDHEALVTLSRLEEAEGDLYTAAEHLLTAWEHDPANGLLRSDLTHRLARLYGSEGYLQYTRPALAALYVRNAYPERAAREYAAALAEQPARVDLRLASVLARWRLGALTEASDGCVVLLGEQPQLVRARWALADALARRGKGEEAREHARHAALLDPDGAIARDLIESNAEATIVDPDEMVRVPLDIPRSGPSVTTFTAHGMPASVSPPSSAWESANNWQAVNGRSEVSTPPEAANHRPMEPLAPTVDDRITSPPPAATPTMDDMLISSASSQPIMDHWQPAEEEHAQEPQESWSADERTAPAISEQPETDAVPAPSDMVLSPPTLDEEPESVTAVVREDGAITTMQPGDEPTLEAEDAFTPRDEPEMPATTSEPPAAILPHAIAAPDVAEDAAAPAPPSGFVPPPFVTTAPEPPASPIHDALPVSDTRASEPPAAAAPSNSSVPPTPVIASTPPVMPALSATTALTPDTLWPAMQERLAAEDAPGALALGRAALTAAGKDTAQVRPLLPAIRALVDAAPNRPDSRRLLGDTYRRLGQTAQAQGQYQQALLVRVAGKK